MAAQQHLGPAGLARVLAGCQSQLQRAELMHASGSVQGLQWMGWVLPREWKVHERVRIGLKIVVRRIILQAAGKTTKGEKRPPLPSSGVCCRHEGT